MTIRRVERTRSRQNVRLRDLDVRVLIPLWIALAMFMARAVMYFASQHHLGVDAHAYWLAARHAHPYGAAANTPDAFLYSPAFAHVIWPLARLPWPAFFGVWAAAEAFVFAWLLRPLGWAWGVPAFLLCGFEIEQGNVNAFLAFALVAGMRSGAYWAMPALTKITNTLGPIWYVARRDWAALIRFVLTVAAIATASIAISPHLWLDWFRLLSKQHGGGAGLALRVGGAVVITVFAARKRSAWLLAPAMVLASPVLQGIGEYLSLLAAIPRLRAFDRADTAHVRRTQEAHRTQPRNRGEDHQ